MTSSSNPREKTCRKCSAKFSNSYCKVCKKAYAALNADSIKAKKAARYLKNMAVDKARMAAYDSANKEEIKKRHAAYYIANREKAMAYSVAKYTENPEKARNYSAAYRAANREQVLAANAAWAAANPEIRRIHHHNRRARIERSGGTLSKGLSAKLYKLQKGRCACCGQPLADDYQLDHIMPIALGGANTDDNIQLLRALCNRQKKAKHPVDFMQSRGFLI